MPPVTPSARLRLFGGASLEDDHGPIAGRGAQRRRIGLLALLATVRRPISRYKLIGLLWEEADTDRARKLLSESLYVIRKALGEDAIVAVGDGVQLNENVIWSDVAEFNAARERGDDESVVELYGGPFLDGFFLSDALEFDNWVESERATFARARAEALARLAARAESAGDFRAAVAWWRKLAEHDPYNSSYAVGLMRVLDASGDRAGALQQARMHTASLREEFDAEPDPQVEAFAQSLQLSPHAVEAAARIEGRLPNGGDAVTDDPAVEARPAAAVATHPAVSVPSRRRRVHACSWLRSSCFSPAWAASCFDG